MPEVSIAELLSQQQRLRGQIPSTDVKERVDALEREVKLLRDGLAELQNIVTAPKTTNRART